MKDQARSDFKTFLAGAVLASFGIVGAGVCALAALCDAMCSEAGGWLVLFFGFPAVCVAAYYVHDAICDSILQRRYTHTRHARQLWSQSFGTGFARWWGLVIVLLATDLSFPLDVGALVMLGIFMLGVHRMSDAVR